MIKYIKLENLITVTVCVTAIVLVAFPQTFLTMLITSFALQILFVFVLIGVLFLLRKQWKKAALVGISCVMIITLFPAYVFNWSSSAFSGDLRGLKVAQFNVLKYNKKYDSVINRALQVNADVISFQEVNKEWEVKMKAALKDVYPHSFIASREDCYGLAVFSKVPLKKMELYYVEDIPSISGVLTYNNQDIDFISCHTRAPLSYGNYKLRNKQMQIVGELMSKAKQPKLIMGDFNSVPWDSVLKKMMRKAKVIDSRKSLAATYPSDNPFVRIPIDYIFHSEEITCKYFKVIEPTSSDHLGVVGMYDFSHKRSLAAQTHR